MSRREIIEDRRGRATARRLPYRAGMISSALGLGVLIIGSAARGSLRIDGSARITAPEFWPDWLVAGGLRIAADGEIGDPRLVFVGLGVMLLLLGAAQILNDRMHRDRLD